MRIASNIIDSIKAKADIVEVIGEYVHLTQKGQNYIGLCPFHSDSTPSLTVSPSKGIYKCFACDVSGDVINFLQEHLKISFVEAVKCWQINMALRFLMILVLWPMTQTNAIENRC